MRTVIADSQLVTRLNGHTKFRVFTGKTPILYSDQLPNGGSLISFWPIILRGKACMTKKIKTEESQSILSGLHNGK